MPTLDVDNTFRDIGKERIKIYLKKLFNIFGQLMQKSVIKVHVKYSEINVVHLLPPLNLIDLLLPSDSEGTSFLSLLFSLADI